MTEQIEQRSPEWFAARCGSLGASQLQTVISKTKAGSYGAGRETLKRRLVVERLTGVQEDGFKSAAMQWGIDQEDNARRAYERYSGDFVTEVGLYRHPAIEGTHASPDGLVGQEGLIEIKCPNTDTHVDAILTGKIPDRYITQMQWQMACAGKTFCDFVSYDPRVPERLQLWCFRIERDDKYISMLESEVRLFLDEVEAELDALRQKEAEAGS